MGPTIKSVAGFSYYVSFLDDFSKFTWVYLLKHKTDVEHVFPLERKLSLSNQIREGNTKNYIPISQTRALPIASHVHTHTSKMGLSNANIVT
jgi:hypothetical protein